MYKDKISICYVTTPQLCGDFLCVRTLIKIIHCIMYPVCVTIGLLVPKLLKLLSCNFIYILVCHLLRWGPTLDGFTQHGSGQNTISSSIASDQHSTSDLRLVMVNPDSTPVSAPMSPDTGDCLFFCDGSIDLSGLLYTTYIRRTARRIDFLLINTWLDGWMETTISFDVRYW